MEKKRKKEEKYLLSTPLGKENQMYRDKEIYS